DAFVRRMHFTVEFPLPGEEDRLRIWRAIWPDALPREGELDLEHLARRFELTGGSIRHIPPAAALRAAPGGGAARMAHPLPATRREIQKLGTVVRRDPFE